MDHVNDDWTMSSLPFPPHRSVSHTAVHGGLQSAAPAKDKSNKSNKHKRNTNETRIRVAAPQVMSEPVDKSVYTQRLAQIRGLGHNFVRHHSHILPIEYFDAACEARPRPHPVGAPATRHREQQVFGIYGIGGIAPIGPILGSAA